MTTTTKKGGIGLKRWIVLGLIGLGIVFAFVLGGIYKPVSPAVVLPGEKVWPSLPEFVIGPSFSLTLTNTLLATLIADVVLILMALGAVNFVRSGKLVPQGFYNFFEFLVEFLWDATENAAGAKWAKRIFPYMATIFLLVFVSNMVKLVPGFESIGYLKAAHGTVKGYAPVQILPGIYAIDGSHEVPHADEAHSEGTDAHSTEGTDSHSTEGEATDTHGTEAAGAAAEGICTSCEVVPFLRGSATDLNFTFALAIIAVVMIQVFGFQALGPGYLTKFFNLKTIISKPFFGFIDFGVGLLELVSEFSKVLSFGFRLFGNIFAGALLLSILGALTAVVVPSMLYALEIFVGLIQAYVFSMLALVFMSQATVSHHGDDHGGEHGAEAAHH